ncbi:MAG TPA: dolichyl-phosphate beta-glucosyltransferase [Terriglobia bacterium]|nr:dolichyl-phosphate beta-glucosyltransferase [Terriglobia bacterium]
MATSETSVEAHTVAATSSTVPKVSIVVPAFNEAVRIRGTIQKIETFRKSVPWDAEVIVVDDGSQDRTGAVVAGMNLEGVRVIRNEPNRGKGFAVKTGVLQSRGEYVLFTDADLSAPIAELEKLLSAAEAKHADVVIGSRAIDRSYIEKHQSRGRELGGIVFNLIVRMILGLRIYDTQCGFKLFRRAKTLSLFQKMTITGFGFDPELLFLASRSGMQVLELPVRWSHAEGSKIRFMRDSVKMFSDLLRIRWNQITGRYS